MRAYLSVPIIANRSTTRARIIADALADAGHELVSPWVLDDMEIRPSPKLNIFERDVSAVKECDFIVADVSSPSTGVGMEVMTAYLSGKKVILVAAKGSVITRMLTDMVGAEWVMYENDETLSRNLKIALKSIY